MINDLSVVVNQINMHFLCIHELDLLSTFASLTSILWKANTRLKSSCPLSKHLFAL